MACEMLFLLLVLFLLSPACRRPRGMPGHKEHSCHQSQVEATGRLCPAAVAQHFQREPPSPAALTPQRGIHDAPSAGSEQEKGPDFQASTPVPSRGQKS